MITGASTLLCASALSSALAFSGCQALHHATALRPHESTWHVPTGIPHLGIVIIWGMPGALPPAAMDARRNTGIGLVPTLTFPF